MLRISVSSREMEKGRFSSASSCSSSRESAIATLCWAIAKATWAWVRGKCEEAMREKDGNPPGCFDSLRAKNLTPTQIEKFLGRITTSGTPLVATAILALC